VTHGPSFKRYEHFTASERQVFNKWLGANAGLSAVLAVGIITIAVVGAVTSSHKKPAGAEMVAKAPPQLTQPGTTGTLPAGLIVPVVDKR